MTVYAWTQTLSLDSSQANHSLFKIHHQLWYFSLNKYATYMPILKPTKLDAQMIEDLLEAIIFFWAIIFFFGKLKKAAYCCVF